MHQIIYFKNNDDKQITNISHRASVKITQLKIYMNLISTYAKDERKLAGTLHLPICN